MSDVKSAALSQKLTFSAGLQTTSRPISRERWTPDDLAPYLARTLEVFGEDRLIFGGDWPVLLLASSYERWIETLAVFTRKFSPEAKRKLWAENARHVYLL